MILPVSPLVELEALLVGTHEVRAVLILAGVPSPIQFLSTFLCAYVLSVSLVTSVKLLGKLPYSGACVL